MLYWQNYVKSECAIAGFTVSWGRSVIVSVHFLLHLFFLSLFLPFFLFLDAPSHLYKRCPSVGPSVRRSEGPSVPCYFRRWKVHILGESYAVYPALFSFSFTFSFFHSFSLSFILSDLRSFLGLLFPFLFSDFYRKLYLNSLINYHYTTKTRSLGCRSRRQGRAGTGVWHDDWRRDDFSTSTVTTIMKMVRQVYQFEIVRDT